MSQVRPPIAPPIAQDEWWNPAWVLRTGRMIMRPVTGADAGPLAALKADPLAYAMMLGGVRTQFQAAEELAEEIRAWGAYGIGLWSARDDETNAFYGVAGIVHRHDGRGMALRFAFWPEARGQGLAREAAVAALRFAHERAGLARVIAVARESNAASRMLLASIGMREVPEEDFRRDGYRMVVYVSETGGLLLPYLWPRSATPKPLWGEGSAIFGPLTLS
jgi:RimJ/RimL family protein N-acetyltransferase